MVKSLPFLTKLQKQHAYSSNCAVRNLWYDPPYCYGRAAVICGNLMVGINEHDSLDTTNSEFYVSAEWGAGGGGGRSTNSHIQTEVFVAIFCVILLIVLNCIFLSQTSLEFKITKYSSINVAMCTNLPSSAGLEKCRKVTTQRAA